MRPSLAAALLLVATVRRPAGDGPGVVAVADVNGDGRLDLVVVNERSGDASVLLGDGRRGFAPAPGGPVAAGPSPNDVAVGDFDGDGTPDLAFANHEAQRLTVAYGDGRGAFSAAVAVPVRVKPHPHGVAAADFDEDGCADLVTDSWADDRLLLLFGAKGPAAPFARSRSLGVGRHPYQRIRVADVNGDGHADIVSPNLDGGDVTILLGDGKGSFRQPPGSPFPCGDSPFNVAVGDVNGDGLADLAVVDSPSSAAASGRDGLFVLLGDGRGGFRPAPGAPIPTERHPNLVAVGGRGGVAVSFPDGDRVVRFSFGRSGRLASRRDVAVGGHPKGVAIGDLDGDGREDLVVAQNAAAAVTVLFGE